jgi:DNA-binding CsgD family transcriptional regulator
VGFDHWLLARAAVAECAGDTSEADQRLRLAWQRCEDLGWVISRRETGPGAVRLAVERGDGEFAAAVAAKVEQAARLAGAPSSMRAAADHCAGLVANDAELVRRAADVYSRVGRRFAMARALEDVALVAGRAERRADTRDALVDAAAEFLALGADVDRLRAEQKLRGLGVRRGAAGPRRRAETGWQSLTGSELQICRLAAQGLTNREIGERLFVSHRTVATHLAHIFGKVGLSSRVELARAMGQADMDNKSVT